MKQFLFYSLALVLLLGSCKKDKDDASGRDNTVEATIDGTKLVFNVTSATLIRHFQSNVKRLELYCMSTDNQHRIVLSLNNKVPEGDGMEIKTYKMGEVLYPDPSTPGFEGDGDFTYSKRMPGNYWNQTPFPAEGKIEVTSNNVNGHTISGNFEILFRDPINGSDHTEIKSGSIKNVTYKVSN